MLNPSKTKQRAQRYFVSSHRYFFQATYGFFKRVPIFGPICILESIHSSPAMGSYQKWFAKKNLRFFSTVRSWYQENLPGIVTPQMMPNNPYICLLVAISSPAMLAGGFPHPE